MGLAAYGRSDSVIAGSGLCARCAKKRAGLGPLALTAGRCGALRTYNNSRSTIVNNVTVHRVEWPALSHKLSRELSRASRGSARCEVEDVGVVEEGVDVRLVGVAELEECRVLAAKLKALE